MTTPATGPSGGDVPEQNQKGVPTPTNAPVKYADQTHVTGGKTVTHVEGRQHRGHGHKHTPGE